VIGIWEFGRGAWGWREWDYVPGLRRFEGYVGEARGAGVGRGYKGGGEGEVRWDERIRFG